MRRLLVLVLVVVLETPAGAQTPREAGEALREALSKAAPRTVLEAVRSGVSAGTLAVTSAG